MAKHPEGDLPGPNGPKHPHDDSGALPPDFEDTVDFSAPPANAPDPSEISAEWAALFGDSGVIEVDKEPFAPQPVSPEPVAHASEAPPTEPHSDPIMEVEEFHDVEEVAPEGALAGMEAIHEAAKAEEITEAPAAPVAEVEAHHDVAEVEEIAEVAEEPLSGVAAVEEFHDVIEEQPLSGVAEVIDFHDVTEAEEQPLSGVAEVVDFHDVTEAEEQPLSGVAEVVDFHDVTEAEEQPLSGVAEVAEFHDVAEVAAVVEQAVATPDVLDEPFPAIAAEASALSSTTNAPNAWMEPTSGTSLGSETPAHAAPDDFADVPVTQEDSGLDLAALVYEPQDAEAELAPEHTHTASTSGVDLGAEDLIAVESPSSYPEVSDSGTYQADAVALDSGVNLGDPQSHEVPLGVVDPLSAQILDTSAVGSSDSRAPTSSTVDLGGVNPFSQDLPTRNPHSDRANEDSGFHAVGDVLAEDQLDLGAAEASAVVEQPLSASAVFVDDVPEEDIFEEAVVSEELAAAAPAETIGFASDEILVEDDLVEEEAAAVVASTEDEFDGDLDGTRNETMDDLDSEHHNLVSENEALGSGAIATEEYAEAPVEETVAEEEVGEPEPPKRGKRAAAISAPMESGPRPSRMAWFGGGVLLTSLLAVVGVAALVGAKPAWFVKLLGAAPPAKSGNPVAAGPGGAAVSQDMQKALESKDPEQVRLAYERKLAEENKDSTDPKEVVRKGRIFAENALKEKPDEPVNLDSDKARKVIDDLKAAADKDPGAALELGRIYEYGGKLKAALETYQNGLRNFANNRPLMDGVRRVSRKMPAAADANSRVIPQRHPAVELALLLVFRPDEPNITEAGSYFLEAVDQAEEGNFDEAKKSLDAAMKLHSKNRRLNPGKGQNPGSDPDEEIFLFACDLLKNYFDLQQQLAKANLLVLPKMPASAARVKKVSDDTRAALGIAISEGLVGKKYSDALTKALGAKPAEKQHEEAIAALEALVKARKNEEETLGKVAERLSKDSADLAATNKKLDAVVAALDTAKKIDDKDKPAEAVDKLLKDLTTADTEAKEQKKIAEVAKKESAELVKIFVPKVVPEEKREDAPFVQSTLEALVTAYDTTTKKMDLDKLVTEHVGLKADLTKATSKIGKLEETIQDDAKASKKAIEDLMTAQLAKLAEQKQAFEERTKLLRPVAQVLPAYAAALKDPDAPEAADLIDQALADSEMALKAKDPKTEGLAMLVRGLVFLAQKKPEDAKQILTMAKEKLADDKVHLAQVTDLLAFLDDPSKPIMERVARLQQWPGGEILQLLGRASQIIDDPKKKGVLQAERSLLLLERAQMAPEGADKDLPLAKRKDIQDAMTEAGAAAMANVARGYYAVGRIGEVVDPINGPRKALANYKKAMELATDPAEKALYRSAYARVLPYPQLPVEPEKPVDKGARLDTPEGREMLATLLTVMFFGPVEEQKARDEATAVIKELEQIPLERRTPPQLEALAEAYRLTGQFDLCYDMSLRLLEKKVGPEAIAGLRRLQKDIFRDRQTFVERRVAEGEYFYVEGVRKYFARNNDLAVKDLDAAIAADNTDARYYYYRGLAKLAEGKPEEADADFRLGVPLERANQPSRFDVNRALERVQNGPRRTLDNARARP